MLILFTVLPVMYFILYMRLISTLYVLAINSLMQSSNVVCFFLKGLKRKDIDRLLSMQGATMALTNSLVQGLLADNGLQLSLLAFYFDSLSASS